MTSQEIQQATMQLSPEYRKRYEEERVAFFNETFEFEPFPEWDKYRVFLGSLVNETQLGVSATTYAALFFSATIEKYNVGNMVSICQASEKATLDKYMQSTKRIEGVNPISIWCDTRQYMEVITQQLNEVIEPAMTKIVKKLLALQFSLSNGNGGARKNIALT